MTSPFKPPKDINIENLELDSKNPRIPLDKQSLSPDELTLYVAETYNAVAIARSIVAHEFFPSEPLIAIAKGSSGKFVVVEGNRRLSALKLLHDKHLRARLADPAEWNALDTTSPNIPEKVPVIVAASREDVAPIIGYRHIAGIQPWDAYAKARYISMQLTEGRSIEQTAVDVGETPAEVRANFRNFQISEQARTEVSEEVYEDLTDRFGVFTRAMQSGDLRSFVGAPAPNQVVTSKKPIPSSKRAELKEFVGYLFGPQAVVTDSRDLTKLGRVLASDEGLKALRAGQNLEEAHVASGGLRDRVIDRLSNAARALRAVKPDIAKYRKDQDVKNLIEECDEALEEVKQAHAKGG
jgi:hypothetical protein